MLVNKAQLLLEVILILGLIVIILGIFASSLVVILSAQKYADLNQGIALLGFYKYRSALISLSQNKFDDLNSLPTSTDHYLAPTSTGWEIKSGKEEVKSKGESYFFSFQIVSNFEGDPDVKLVKIKGEYQNLTFEDYLLLPRLNVSF